MIILQSCWSYYCEVTSPPELPGQVSEWVRLIWRCSVWQYEVNLYKLLSSGRESPICQGRKTGDNLEPDYIHQLQFLFPTPLHTCRNKFISIIIDMGHSIQFTPTVLFVAVLELTVHLRLFYLAVLHISNDRDSPKIQIKFFTKYNCFIK